MIVNLLREKGVARDKTYIAHVIASDSKEKQSIGISACPKRSKYNVMNRKRDRGMKPRRRACPSLLPE
jgi:hypothetical protein